LEPLLFKLFVRRIDTSSPRAAHVVPEPSKPSEIPVPEPVGAEPFIEPLFPELEPVFEFPCELLVFPVYPLPS
jgi:hypothetical protein